MDEKSLFREPKHVLTNARGDSAEQRSPRGGSAWSAAPRPGFEARGADESDWRHRCVSVRSREQVRGLPRGAQASPPQTPPAGQSRCPLSSPRAPCPGGWSVRGGSQTQGTSSKKKGQHLAPGRQQFVSKNQQKRGVKTGGKTPKKEANFLLAKLSSRCRVFLFLAALLFRQNHPSPVPAHRCPETTGFRQKTLPVMRRPACRLPTAGGEERRSFRCC